MIKYALVILVLVFGSCHTAINRPPLHFNTLSSASTGVSFENQITESDSLNMFVNEYTYMGAGVGIGDFNNDGFQDIFFAANQSSSKLYQNKGNLQFEDITTKAGVATTGWCTGVSVVDINNDGWKDIYVCVSGRVPSDTRKNLLFINRHDGSFSEEAASYGLADTSFSTQAAFFDFDSDGRLDMYLLNHTLSDRQPNDIRDSKAAGGTQAGDKLFHNEGNLNGVGHPFFKDVSNESGIVEDGNGLGITLGDFNHDGRPDIYVANDYIKNDLLWLNKVGGFTNCIGTAMRHQSYSSMGCDASDVNNDGNTDVISLDMQPETNERKKMMYSFLTDQRHQMEVAKGYEPEYIHNMLQLNNGTRKIGGENQPFFSEVGEMAGIAETDWSWSVLIADLDNDGWKDVQIGNGLGRDPTNIDFLEYRYNTVLQTHVPDNDPGLQQTFMKQLSALGEVRLKNYVYRNKGGFTFDDVSIDAGIDQASISNGSAYVDLDNDGDLDLVVNNINSEAFIMRNDLRESDDKGNSFNFLTVQLQGASENRDAIGAKVIAYSKGTAQTLEEFPVRGYLSTVDDRLHFGFGENEVDSVEVIWPDQLTQTVVKPAINSFLDLDYKNARKQLTVSKHVVSELFKDVAMKSNINFTHNETPFFDYAFQPLIQQKYSQEGPFISTGDVNGDGLEDFFIGGAFNQAGEIYLQKTDGSFLGHALVTGTKNEEDMQSVLFDADGDGDSDLLVVSGSSEFEPNSPFYRPRLYSNNGSGDFKLNEGAFSTLISTPCKAIAVGDFDGDGDQDVFIGGRVSLGTFPQPVGSHLLRNDHGVFTDVTRIVCPALEQTGLINAAKWIDIDRDGKPDLVIASDWSPLRIFINTGNSLKEVTQSAGLSSLSGFWRSLQVEDVDGDGDLDIIAGNEGLNNPYHITGERPAELIAKDFDNNGMVEPILCYYIKGNDGKYVLSSGVSRDEWAMQMPSLKKIFDKNELYAKAGMNEIFTPSMTDGAVKLQCREVRSGYFENRGSLGFTFHPFSNEAQIAPVNSIVVTDVNVDGKSDLIIAGNDYQASVFSGRYDASYGLVMYGNGKGTFRPIPPTETGLILDGDVKDLKLIRVRKRAILLTAINNEKLRAFEIGR